MIKIWLSMFVDKRFQTYVHNMVEQKFAFDVQFDEKGQAFTSDKIGQCHDRIIGYIEGLIDAKCISTG